MSDKVTGKHKQASRCALFPLRMGAVTAAQQHPHLRHRQQPPWRGAEAEVNVFTAAGAWEARIEALRRVAHRHVGRDRPWHLR